MMVTLHASQGLELVLVDSGLTGFGAISVQAVPEHHLGCPVPL